MIGVDLLEISKFEKVLGRHGDRFLKRIFTEIELSYFYRLGPKKIVVAELAARYAAKEAVSKVLGTGIKVLGSKGKIGVFWQEVEIITEFSGKPRVVLSGWAKKRAEELGFKEIHISLTHIKDLAQAIALAEKA